MSDLSGKIVAGFCILGLGVVLGVAGSQAISASGEALDRACYQEVGPEYIYESGSATYWNGTLTADCRKEAFQPDEQNREIQLNTPTRPGN